MRGGHWMETPFLSHHQPGTHLHNSPQSRSGARVCVGGGGQEYTVGDTLHTHVHIHTTTNVHTHTHLHMHTQLSGSTPSLVQPPHNHRKMFDKMLDEVVNHCFRTIDLNRIATQDSS